MDQGLEPRAQPARKLHALHADDFRVKQEFLCVWSLKIDAEKLVGYSGCAQPNFAGMERNKMATWKQNYAKARSMVWVTYLAALWCFWMAVSGVHENGGQFGIGFVFWVAMAVGLSFSAGRTKRKFAAKARG